MTSGNAIQQVEEIYKFLRAWEVDFTKTPSEQDIQKLKNDLAKLSTNTAIEVQKLSALADHFHRDLSARELSILSLPFERALNKSLRDDEFLVSEKDSPGKRGPSFPLIFVLENLRSAFNVGAFFRLGEALGLQEIILTGYTAGPDNEKIKKTTLGTENWIPWQQIATSPQAIQKLKDQGYYIVAIETAKTAKDLDSPFPSQKTAFIFGNERFGLDLQSLQLADELRQIPLQGQKNSLNVASCAAICAHEWIRQWKNSK